MKRSAQVVAPLLASAAIGLLTGCHGEDSQCVNNETHQVVDASFCRNGEGAPVTTHTYHLQPTGTLYGGFGELFEVAAAAALIFGAGKIFGTGG